MHLYMTLICFTFANLCLCAAENYHDSDAGNRIHTLNACDKFTSQIDLEFRNKHFEELQKILQLELYNPEIHLFPDIAEIYFIRHGHPNEGQIVPAEFVSNIGYDNALKFLEDYATELINANRCLKTTKKVTLHFAEYKTLHFTFCELIFQGRKYDLHINHKSGFLRTTNQ